MEYSEFFARFGGAARTKHLFRKSADPKKRNLDGRRFIIPEDSEIPAEFIRMCPWEIEYLFTIARRARTGIIETGRFNGGSLFVMAAAAPKNLPIYSLDISPRDDARLREILAKFLPENKIDIIIGDSQKTKYPQIGKVDLLFIDGDHSYEGCLNDIENWYNNLLPGGHLVFHDAYLGAYGVQDAIMDFSERHPELVAVASPHIGAKHWYYPTGSIAHLIKRA